MALNSVTSSLSLFHTQQVKDGNIKSDDLKGITPSKGELREHLMFHLNNFFKSKVVCSEQDIYAVNCQTAARNIHKDITPRQLTSGCGGG